jgi:hypothetical protein
MSLTRNGQHPLRSFSKSDGTIPTPWSEGIWSVFINDQEQLHSAIRYVDRHSEKEGLSPQRWQFITSV